MKKKYTILYIEDDQAVRQLVQFILERRNDLSLLEADSGAAGIEMAKVHLPEIILLDLNLPDLDGFTVLDQLQNGISTKHIPVIAVSGDSTQEDINQGLQAGLQGYLTKPIEIIELYGIIDKYIGSSS